MHCVFCHSYWLLPRDAHSPSSSIMKVSVVLQSILYFCAESPAFSEIERGNRSCRLPSLASYCVWFSFLVIHPPFLASLPCMWLEIYHTVFPYCRNDWDFQLQSDNFVLHPYRKCCLSYCIIDGHCIILIK